MTTADSMEDILVAVMEQEQKYAGRWGFLDSISNMGRKHEDRRPKETGAQTDAQRKREETGAGSESAGEPSEPVE